MTLWLVVLLSWPLRAAENKAVSPELSAPVAPGQQAQSLSPVPAGLVPLSPAAAAPALEVPSDPIQAQAPLLPATQVPAAQAAAEPAQASVSGLTPALDRRFDELVHAFDHKRDTLEEGNSPVEAAARGAIVGAARARLNAQLEGMAEAEPEDKPLLDLVGGEGSALLAAIDARMERGEIDPRAKLRASASDPPVPVSARELRVGVYPVAADPFQWGHLLIALRAIDAFRLDKVIFVLAGDDVRKPNMTTVSFRHPMGRAVLDEFAPFFEYSSIAVGTDYDGETNIFRILRLNPAQKMQAFYLVGGDHYKLKDKKGNPDTLPKLEANLLDPKLGFDPRVHAVKAAFIQREGADEHVPTTIDTYFLPEVPFAASSTLVREGRHALMPYAAYRYVQKHRPGLYGVPKQERD